MSVSATSAASHVEILTSTGGFWRTFRLVPEYETVSETVDGERRTYRVPKPIQIPEAQAALDPGATPIKKRIESRLLDAFSRGAGLDYNVAPGINTRGGDFAIPAGESTNLSIPAGNNSSTPIQAMEEAFGDLWFLQVGTVIANQPRVMRSVGKTGALADSLTVGANNYLFDLTVADNGSGAPVLWASGGDTSGGRLHRWDGSSWTSTASGTFGTNARLWLARQFWEVDGVGAHRLVAVTGNNTIAYTRPNSDPLLAASWVEGVRIGTTGTLRKPAAFRRALYFPADDGLWYLDEQGNSHNLTSYHEQTKLPWTGWASLAMDDYVYLGYGQGLDRVYVGDGPVLQNTPGLCTPGLFTRAEHTYRGFTTALGYDQGYLLDAIFNPHTLRAAVWYGKDRRSLGIDSPNPLIWYGPEVVGNENQRITAMKVAGITLTGALLLWIAAIPYDPAGLNYIGGAPTVSTISLPIAGTPLDDLLSGGTHRFTRGIGTGIRWQDRARLELLPEDYGNRTSRKIVDRHRTLTAGMPSAGTSINLQTRADPTPAQTTYPVSHSIAGFVAEVIPTTGETLDGYEIGRRLEFIAGTNTTPAVLKAIQTSAWRVEPAVTVVPLTIEWGDGVTNHYGSNINEGFSPDQIRDELVAAGQTGKLQIRMPWNEIWILKIEQEIEATATLVPGGTFGKKYTATIEADLISRTSPAVA